SAVPRPAADREAMAVDQRDVFDRGIRAAGIQDAPPGRPAVARFRGPVGDDCAAQLFHAELGELVRHADSGGVLARQLRGGSGRLPGRSADADVRDPYRRTITTSVIAQPYGCSISCNLEVHMTDRIEKEIFLRAPRGRRSE